MESGGLIGHRSVFHITAYFLPESHAFTQKETPLLCLEGLVMLLNTAMFNIFHPGTLLPADSRVILLPDGREVEYDDASRSLMRKIVDPLDFGGLLKPSKQDPVHVPYSLVGVVGISTVWCVMGIRWHEGEVMTDGEGDGLSASQNFGYRNSPSFDEVELSTNTGFQRLDITEPAGLDYLESS